MEKIEFDALVRQLEQAAEHNPLGYRWRVFGLALLGYGYIMLVVTLLLAANGGLVYALLHEAPTFVVVKLGLLIGAITLIVLRALWVRIPPPTGMKLTAQQAPELYAMLNEIRRQLNGPKIHQVLLNAEFNAAVMQHPRLGILGWHKNYLLLGMPLVQALSPEQLQAVLAHEYGHLSGAHSKFSAWIYRIRRSWQQVMQRLEDSDHSWGQILFTGFFHWYIPFFNAYSFVLARLNEYDADRSAVQVAGSQAAAQALINVEVKARFLEDEFWRQLYATINKHPNPVHQPFTLMPKAWKKLPAKTAGTWLTEAWQQSTSNEDTHPCLRDRLTAINESLQLPMPINQNAAEHYFGDHLPTLLTALNQQWQDEVQDYWQHRHQAIQQDKQTLKNLLARAKTDILTLDEKWTCARLVAELYNADKAVKFYQAVLKQDAHHPGANYALGELLLNKQNPKGVAFLNRAMNDDASYTLDACRAIYDFLHANGQTAAAQNYWDKLQQRYELESKAYAERQAVDIQDGLMPHSLTPAELLDIVDELRQHPGIKSAYLVGKVVDYLPESPCYVLGIVRTYSLLRTGSGDRKYNEYLVDELNIPNNILIVVFGTETRHFYDRIYKVPKALIYQKSRQAKPRATAAKPPVRQSTRTINTATAPTAQPVHANIRRNGLWLGGGVLLGLVAVMLWLDNPVSRYWQQVAATFFTSTPTEHRPIDPPSPPMAIKPVAQPTLTVLPLAEQLQRFEWQHALHYDLRLATGLQQAIQQYFQLFMAQPAAPIITYTAQQQSQQQFELRYQVAIAAREMIYPVQLSTGPDQINANLTALVNVLQQVRQDFPPTLNLATAKTVSPRLNARIGRTLGELDTLALLQLVQQLEQAVLDGTEPPQVLLAVSEVFAWLGFFSQGYRHPGLADLLASQAVSTYVLGHLFSPASEHSGYYQGILLLMLDYPAAALTPLMSTTDARQQQMAELLRAFIQFDFTGLQRLAQQPNTNQKIATYLIGRSYEDSNQYNLAPPFYRQLLERYPDFLLAKAYIADNAPVGMARVYSYQYFSQLIEQQATIINTLLESDWQTRSQDLYKAVKVFLVAGKHGQEWLIWQRDVLQRETPLQTGAGILLTAQWLRAFLQQELNNALASLYNLELRRLARQSVAEGWLNAIAEAYPDAPLTTALRLQLWQQRKQAREAFAVIAQFPMQHADKFLLAEILDTHGLWNRTEQRPAMIQRLQRFQQLLAPNFKDSLQLASYADWLGYVPSARQHVQHALALNPYSHRAYARLAQNSTDDAFIQRGAAYAGQNYGFLIAVAHWYQQQGQLDNALSYYRQALDASPVQSTAYLRSGELYVELEQPDNALAIWQLYLQYDDNTLSAVRIRNAMGQLYLAQDQPKQAYALFQQTVDSYQYGAMKGYAQSLEALQRINDAEDAFRAAVKRYPGSEAPIELALFYLRHDQPRRAIKILKQHNAYHHASYYYAALVAFMLEQETPLKAIEIVEHVEADSEYLPFYLAQLAEEYIAQQRPEFAQQLLHRLATVTEQPRRTQPYFFGVKYVAAVAETQPAAVLATTQALLTTYATLPEPVMVYFALGLIQAGYADAGLVGMIRAIERSPRNRQTHLILAALAWQLGGQTEADKRTLQALLDRYGVSDWAHLRIQFLLAEVELAEVWQQANSLDRQCEVHYYLAAIYAKQGDDMRAIQHALLSLESQATGNIEYELAMTLLETLT